jgi:hypothetical protein
MCKAKKQKKSSKKSSIRVVYRDRLAEADSTYFLKLVVVVLLSTLWLKFATPLSWQNVPLGAFPLGALVAIIGIRLYEKNAIDRKIWFAVIVIVTILSYFVPAGIVI